MGRRRGVLVVALATFVVCRLSAQTPDTTRRGSGGTVTGTVYDSIARSPLAGATVQLALAANLSTGALVASADSVGRYTLRGVPAGRYLISFVHPMLDSLGIDAPIRQVDVVADRVIREDLAIPSPPRLRASACRVTGGADSTSAIIGIVRDAKTLGAIASSSVSALWLELAFDRTGLRRSVRGTTAKSLDNGWFALCGLPSSGWISLVGAFGGDTTATIELQIPPDRLLRRDLYVGPSRWAAAASGSTAPSDSSSPTPRSRVGDFALRGRVVAAATGQPIAGAQVGIADGPSTSANGRGDWVLPNAPGGTQTLTVRAVGYYPDSRPVNVVTGARPVALSLSTLRAVLDTMKVTAAKPRVGSGFQERRRTGVGRYLGPQDIERLHPLFTSDLFRTIPSVRIVQTDFLNKKIAMRGGGRRGTCDPAIYLDGMRMPQISVADLDGWARPDELAGIEVYTIAEVPAQYQTLNGCGAILLWTK